MYKNRDQIKKEEYNALSSILHDVYYKPPRPHAPEDRFLGSAIAKTFNEAVEVVIKRQEITAMFPELRTE